MKKITKILFSPVTTIAAFALAAGLLLFASIGGTQAALTYFSETYTSRYQLYDIGVTLRENGKDISWRDYDYIAADGSWDEHIGVLLGDMLTNEKGGQDPLRIGYGYTENLSVLNSGTINQYVRVSVYRYWEVPNGVDAKGNTIWVKSQNYDPALIDLHFTNIGTYWVEDTGARTTERTVLYYTRLLNADEETPLFADRITIDGHIADFAEKVKLADGTIKTVYDYAGARFVLEATVDAVQENNANDAVLSAWGKHVSVNEAAGTLTLLGQ